MSIGRDCGICERAIDRFPEEPCGPIIKPAYALIEVQTGSVDEQPAKTVHGPLVPSDYGTHLFAPLIVKVRQLLELVHPALESVLGGLGLSEEFGELSQQVCDRRPALAVEDLDYLNLKTVEFTPRNDLRSSSPVEPTAAIAALLAGSRHDLSLGVAWAAESVPNSGASDRRAALSASVHRRAAHGPSDRQ